MHVCTQVSADFFVHAALSSVVKIRSWQTIEPGTLLFEPGDNFISVASSLSPSIFISLPPELIMAKPKGHNLCEQSGAPQYRKHLQKPNTVHDP